MNTSLSNAICVHVYVYKREQQGGDEGLYLTHARDCIKQHEESEVEENQTSLVPQLKAEEFTNLFNIYLPSKDKNIQRNQI